MRYFIQFLLLLTLISTTFAQSIEVSSFASAKQERRYQDLIDEIRCPVCQGQSIGGSNAELANDLRDKVKELILSGKNNDNIREFMVARYGNYVVFKPPVNKNTYLLWFLPFGFLAIALFLFIRSFHHQQNSPEIDTIKAKDLLK
ncbi:MAG: cytochrome c-type biogenesis protein CcmH [Candidatus Thioglobus sp.]|nr:MAG: cytochrome c-type biogenesis protein CcmH [Candidatus Thioglobus sp.]KAA0454070.1 MAG: cytochrome c-type biogenesis protein CcmH [Candidatus Thioglobus sp.]